MINRSRLTSEEIYTAQDLSSEVGITNTNVYYSFSNTIYQVKSSFKRKKPHPPPSNRGQG